MPGAQTSGDNDGVARVVGKRAMSQYPFAPANDEPAACDSLGFASSIEELEALVSGLEPPVVVSVEGPWGSGKTSFLEQLWTRLAGTPRQGRAFVHGCAGVYLGWCSPWKFDAPRDARTNLLTTFIGATEGGTKELRRRVRKPLEAVLCTLGVAAEATAPVGGAALARILTSCDAPVAETLRAQLESTITSPEDGASVWVFVDDLDRCRDDVALGVLETIRQYLGLPRTVLVLAADWEQLRGIICRARGLSPIEAEQYLEKIVQVRWPVPLPKEDALTDWAAAFIPESDVLRLFSKAVVQVLGRNPRRVKQLALTVAGRAEDERPLAIARVCCRDAMGSGSQIVELVPEYVVKLGYRFLADSEGFQWQKRRADLLRALMLAPREYLLAKVLRRPLPVEDSLCTEEALARVLAAAEAHADDSELLRHAALALAVLRWNAPEDLVRKGLRMLAGICDERGCEGAERVAWVRTRSAGMFALGSWAAAHPRLCLRACHEALADHFRTASRSGATVEVAAAAALGLCELADVGFMPDPTMRQALRMGALDAPAPLREACAVALWVFGLEGEIRLNVSALVRQVPEIGEEELDSLSVLLPPAGFGSRELRTAALKAGLEVLRRIGVATLAAREPEEQDLPNGPLCLVTQSGRDCVERIGTVCADHVAVACGNHPLANGLDKELCRLFLEFLDTRTSDGGNLWSALGWGRGVGEGLEAVDVSPLLTACISMIHAVQSLLDNPDELNTPEGKYLKQLLEELAQGSGQVADAAYEILYPEAVAGEEEETDADAGDEATAT